MSPVSTLRSCGSSSSLYRRRNRPLFVTRGSLSAVVVQPLEARARALVPIAIHSQHGDVVQLVAHRRNGVLKPSLHELDAFFRIAESREQEMLHVLQRSETASDLQRPDVRARAIAV